MRSAFIVGFNNAAVSHVEFYTLIARADSNNLIVIFGAIRTVNHNVVQRGRHIVSNQPQGSATVYIDGQIFHHDGLAIAGESKGTLATAGGDGKVVTIDGYALVNHDIVLGVRSARNRRQCNVLENINHIPVLRSVIINSSLEGFEKLTVNLGDTVYFFNLFGVHTLGNDNITFIVFGIGNTCTGVGDGSLGGRAVGDNRTSNTVANLHVDLATVLGGRRAIINIYQDLNLILGIVFVNIVLGLLYHHIGGRIKGDGLNGRILGEEQVNRLIGSIDYNLINRTLYFGITLLDFDSADLGALLDDEGARTGGYDSCVQSAAGEEFHVGCIQANYESIGPGEIEVHISGLLGVSGAFGIFQGNFLAFRKNAENNLAGNLREEDLFFIAHGGVSLENHHFGVDVAVVAVAGLVKHGGQVGVHGRNAGETRFHQLVIVRSIETRDDFHVIVDVTGEELAQDVGAVVGLGREIGHVNLAHGVHGVLDGHAEVHGLLGGVGQHIEHEEVVVLADSLSGTVSSGGAEFGLTLCLTRDGIGHDAFHGGGAANEVDLGRNALGEGDLSTQGLLGLRNAVVIDGAVVGADIDLCQGALQFHHLGEGAGDLEFAGGAEGVGVVAVDGHLAVVHRHGAKVSGVVDARAFLLGPEGDAVGLALGQLQIYIPLPCIRVGNGNLGVRHEGVLAIRTQHEGLDNQFARFGCAGKVTGAEADGLGNGALGAHLEGDLLETAGVTVEFVQLLGAGHHQKGRCCCQEC